MNKSKSTYIRDIQEVKSGVRTKDGQDIPWTLYDITDMDGWHFKTFDDKMFFIGPAYENRTEVVIEYSEELSEKINPNTGKPYINRTIEGVKVAQSIPAELEKRVARLEKAITEAGIDLPKT